MSIRSWFENRRKRADADAVGRAEEEAVESAEEREFSHSTRMGLGADERIAGRIGDASIKVVDGRELEHLAELGLGLGVAVDTEIRDPECLADRRLLRLAGLRLLERDRGLGGHALLQVGPALLEKIEGLAHRRYGKFSFTKSSGSVKSRAFPIWISATSRPCTASTSSNGGPGRSPRRAITASVRPHSGAGRPPGSTPRAAGALDAPDASAN